MSAGPSAAHNGAAPHSDATRETLLRALFSKTQPRGRAARVGLMFGGFALAVLLNVPLCPFAVLTRHPCPGCGLTRATLALLHGDVAESLHFHPLAGIIAPLVAIMLAYNTYSYIRFGRWAATEGVTNRWVIRFGVALAIATLALWIARFFGAFGGPVPV